MKQTFYSNGKLLITGEYLVLDGAKALALPTKFGQDLVVETGNNQEIKWKSFDKDGTVWFENRISFSEITNKTKIVNQPVKNTLIEILHEAFLLNANFINTTEGYTVTTQLTFPRNWGLGTSSTLINNIAQWLQIDALTLLKNSFGGSGYDIACAQNNTPITYQLINGNPEIEKVPFEPDCISNLYFVYLNQKQSSKAAIASYHKKQNNLGQIIPQINAITAALINQSDFETMKFQLNQHETIMSDALGLATVKETLFSDFKGSVKSLGAWGGDFVLVVSKEDPTAYFKAKGFETVISYSDMIL